MIFIVISIVPFIIGVSFFVLGFIRKDLVKWTIGLCALFMSLPCIIISVNNYDPPQEKIVNKRLKTENKFIYRVDPKQSYYLIENNNYDEKRLDTVPYGHLEEYIATDNL